MLPSLDRQATLEAVIIALVTQGRPSITSRGRCKYRGPHDCKCAIGHLISDEYYQDILEGEPVQDDNPRVIRAVEQSLGVELKYKDINFLQELQQSHDQASFDFDEFFERLDEELRDLCKRWNLRFPEELI